MGVIESESGQQANELADVLAVRRFTDGEVMLSWLHTRGHLKKVPTNLVLMTPTTQAQIPLNELNQLIADQRGISLEKLAVNDGSQQDKKSAKTKEIITDEVVVPVEVTEVISELPVTAADLRSMADKLSKQAAEMRRKADEMAPPVKKAAKVSKAEA
jgi:hypothetical protein